MLLDVFLIPPQWLWFGRWHFHAVKVDGSDGLEMSIWAAWLFSE
jgi:hypothetical protein